MTFIKRQFKSIYLKKKIRQPIAALQPSDKTYIIYASTNGSLTRQILETIRIIISRIIRKKNILNYGDLNIKIRGHAINLTNCTSPVTKKGSKSRMGKGKGSIDHYIAIIAKLQPIYIVQNISSLTFSKLFEKIKPKLPFQIKYIKYSNDNKT
jgi:ribosomal protein L16/L10AE